jgi:thiol-disulfide isomerase/thioredoxin
MRKVDSILAVSAAVICGCASPVIILTDPGPSNDAGAKVTPGDDAATNPESDSAAPPDQPDTSPPPCVYPSGPYGKTAGTVLSPSSTWQGYEVGAAAVTTISATDLYDCDGTKGINALLLDESATWCGACQQEAQALPGQMSTWSPQGVKVVTLMVQNASSQPADTSTALDWRNTFSLSSTVAVAADPAFSFAHSGSNGLPMNVLVDPRTMNIVSVVEGYGGADPAVSQLALKNKK